MTTSSQPAQRIFISHSHKDNAFGVRLVDDLRRVLGDESAVWYDVKGGLHGGDAWWRKIVEEVTTRNVFIVVLSPDSMTSPWVNDEIDLAWRQKNTPSLGKRIFPVLYRESNVREDLRNLQIINFLPPRDYEDAFNELLIALGLRTHNGTSRAPKVAVDPETVRVQQMTPQIEASFAAKDWPDVIRKTNFLLKRAPVAITSEIYRMQGVALREEGQVEEAQEAFDTALALVSEREQRLTILRDYADLLALQDRWSEVLRFANEALRLVPNDSSWLATQEHAQSELKRTTPVAEPIKEQEDEELNHLIDEYSPEDIAPLSWTGSFIQEPLKPRVSPVFRKTKEQRLEEGDAHFHAERYEEAIAAYNHVLALDPNNADVYFNRGDAYRELMEYQKAIADYNHVIELDPDNVAAYNNRGDSYRNLKEYQRAIQDLDRAIGLDPKSTDSSISYYNRGLVYYELKEYRKALNDYKRAIVLDPKYAWAFGGRGLTYYHLKDYRRALQDFDQALLLDPTIGWFKSEREDAIRQLRRQR